MILIKTTHLNNISVIVRFGMVDSVTLALKWNIAYAISCGNRSLQFDAWYPKPNSMDKKISSERQLQKQRSGKCAETYHFPHPRNTKYQLQFERSSLSVASSEIQCTCVHVS